MTPEPPPEKSTVDEIRRRFDQEVERFSNLETGQSATVDAPLAMELIAEAAAAVTPWARAALDVGCGAGNYTLKLRERLPMVEVTLLDLSLPMLERARERIAAAGPAPLRVLQGDLREVELAPLSFDIVMAAAVLHHLRTGEEWRAAFEKLFRSLRPGGSLWIFDLIESDLPAVDRMMRERYGRYLESLGGVEYRRRVFDYVEREDTPRSLVYQLDLLREVGFGAVEVLHRNGSFAAFGAVKSR